MKKLILLFFGVQFLNMLLVSLVIRNAEEVTL